LAADRVVRISLEVVGKSPNVIFADADLDAAVHSSRTALTLKSGQVCFAGTMMLVHESIHDGVVELMTLRAGKAVLAPGIEDRDLGPLANEQQLQTVAEYLEFGVEEGSTVVYREEGPKVRRFKTNIFQPAIFTAFKNDMRIAQEETFGPVLSVIPFVTTRAAIQIANDSRFGLTAGVWTSDVSCAHTERPPSSRRDKSL
jgi:aldehyde dehydrogenase (NAD+)